MKRLLLRQGVCPGTLNLPAGMAPGLGNACQTIQAAVNKASVGDTIHERRWALPVKWHLDPVGLLPPRLQDEVRCHIGPRTLRERTVALGGRLEIEPRSTGSRTTMELSVVETR